MPYIRKELQSAGSKELQSAGSKELQGAGSKKLGGPETTVQLMRRTGFLQKIPEAALSQAGFYAG